MSDLGQTKWKIPGKRRNGTHPELIQADSIIAGQDPGLPSCRSLPLFSRHPLPRPYEAPADGLPETAVAESGHDQRHATGKVAIV